MTSWKFCTRQFGVSVMAVLAVGLTLTLLIDSIERSSLLTSVGPVQFLGFILSRLVPLTREVFPLLICCGVAYGVGRMRSRGDLSGLLATGVSPSTLLCGALTVGLSSSLVACILDSATPIANNHAERVAAQASEQGVTPVEGEAAWVPITGGALRVEASTTGELFGLEYVSSESGLSRVTADSAVWVQGEWLLSGGLLYGAGDNLASGDPVAVVDLPPPAALSVILQGARLSYQSVSTLGAIGTDEAGVWWHYRLSRILLVTVVALWGFVFASAFPLAPVSAASLATISSAAVLSVEMVLVQLGAFYLWIWGVSFLAVLATAVLYRRRGITLG